VCRLYKNALESWQYTSCWGALFLLIENDASVLLLKDISTKDTLWECELYPDVTFEKLGKHFCAFEGDDCLWGLSFAEKFDASTFSATVKQWTQSKQAKKKKAKKGFFKSITSSIKNAFQGDDSLEKKKQNVQIGRVQNFERSMHIGFEPGKGFVYENLPAEWKKLFSDAGIQKDDLQDKDTAKRVFKTLKKFEKTQAPPSRPPRPGPRGKPAPPPPRGGGGGPPPPPGAPPPPPPAPSMDKVKSVSGGAAPAPQEGRGDLLAQIRAGTQLRKVEAPPKTKEVDLDLNNMSTAGKNDLMSMLKQSLAKRADAMHSDSDDSDWSNDDGDDDW